MTPQLSESDLARLLPGSWEVAATNFPMWLTGKRVNPVLNYELVTESPLVLKDAVSFDTDAGEAKTLLGRDRFHGGGFTWRGNGLLRLVASHWSVTGVNADGTVVAIQYDRTIATPEGIDILTPVGTSIPDVRSIVATDAATYGLSAEQFASLTWMTTP